MPCLLLEHMYDQQGKSNLRSNTSSNSCQPYARPPTKPLARPGFGRGDPAGTSPERLPLRARARRSRTQLGGRPAYWQRQRARSGGQIRRCLRAGLSALRNTTRGRYGLIRSPTACAASSAKGGRACRADGAYRVALASTVATGPAAMAVSPSGRASRGTAAGRSHPAEPAAPRRGRPPRGTPLPAAR